MQDEFKAAGNSQTLNCSSNDVKVAKVTNIRHLDGTPLTSCNAGSMINFIADFEIATSSSSTRSNIGLYFATAAGQTTALAGTCSDNIIAPDNHKCAGSDILCGSDNYDEFDLALAGDNCGDTSSTDNSPTFGLGAQDVTIEVDNFPCQAPAGQTQLVIPSCTSWQTPGKAISCISPGPDYPWVKAAVPGSPSKCNCGSVQLGITVQAPAVSVTKRCTTADSTGLNTSCTLPESGNVTYTVDMTNQSNFGSIVIDQICDSAYGNIFTAPTFTGPACPAGTAGSKTGTTCSALTIAAGGDQTCTFTASQAESVTVTDTVSVSGHGSATGSFGPTNSNSVSVTSGEALSTATIIKSLSSDQSGCVTERFGVDVQNTSSADETLSLSALSDSYFGDITTTHGSGNAAVLGTTCGQATKAGIGTLSTSAGAGTLPATLAVGGSDYICQFDGTICGTLASITKPDSTTCKGLQNTDRITGTLTGDEGEVVTQTVNSLTVSECFSAYSSSTTP